MPTVGELVQGIQDVNALKGPDGAIMDMVMSLSQRNGIVQDFDLQEGNLDTGHRVARQVGEPTPTKRRLYEGVAPSKAKAAPSDFVTTKLEMFGEVDAALPGGMTAIGKMRDQQRVAKSTAMAKEIARLSFYGNQAVDPREFDGLWTMYSSLTGDGSNQVIGLGGTGADLCSIAFIVHGPGMVYAIHPKGTMAGLQYEDWGKKLIPATAGAAGNKFAAFIDQFIWDFGIVVEDTRDVVRLANIKVGDLTGLTGTQALSASTNILKGMARCPERAEHTDAGRGAYYCPRQVAEMLRVMAVEKVAGSTLTVEQIGGKPVTMYAGFPVRTVDQMLLTESQVV